MSEQQNQLDPMDEIEVKPLAFVASFLGVFSIFVFYMFFWRFLLTL